MANNVMNCDLLVIGAGGSGLVAAVKAADLGVKNTIVLEKAKKAGGSTYYAHGFSVHNSKWQQEAGLPDTREDTFRRLMKVLRWEVNPKLVRNYIYSSGPFFDWFDEKCNVSDYFRKPTKPVVGEQDTAPEDTTGGMKGGINFPYRHINKKSRDPSIGPGWMGSYVVVRMLEQCKKIGIPVLTETRASEFVTDRKGNVTGVLADAKDGKLQINCKACVMAAGGFGANREKLRKRWPERCDNNRLLMLSCPTSDGDTLDMAEKVGAFVDYKNMYWHYGGPVHHPYSYSIYRIMREPEVVYINLNGERWIDETQEATGSYYALCKQPMAVSYAVADHDLTEMLGERLIANPPDGAPDIPNVKTFREDIAYEVSLDEGGVPGNRTKESDTLEGLARKMGVDPQPFVATIKRYNEFCENGQDEDFAKKPEYLIPIRKPPFYAFFGQRFCNITHGGILINENTEVIDSNGEVMPGLFAAGDNAGIHSTESEAVGALTFAVVSGYMAGIAAKKYIKQS